MSDPQKTVFISYRRSTSKHLARAVFMDLRANGYDVFLDVNTIDNGAFDTIILNQIAARAHFILLISPGSMERCANDGDWLRLEIEEAIRLERNIVPIFEEGVNFEQDIKTLPAAAGSHLARMNGIRLFHDYFEAAMDNLRTRYLKTPVYAEIKAPPKAEQVEVAKRIEEAAASNQPKMTAEDYLNRALNRNKYDYEGQINDLNEAIHLNPQFAHAYNHRGSVYYDKGNLEAALADYNEAIHIDPHLARAYNNRGSVYYNKGNLEMALHEFTEAIRLAPKFALAYYGRGNIYEDQHNWDAALQDYNEVIHLYPKFVFAYNNRGNVFRSTGNLSAALQDYNDAIRLDPKYSAAYENRGMLYENEFKDYLRALADYQKAIELGSPRKHELQDWITRIKKKLGKT